MTTQLTTRPVLWEPNPGPQTYFLTTPVDEVLYGGAVGGGKTEAIIMLPAYRMWHPKHQSIILRRESKFLRELIDRQDKIYPILDPGVKWYESKDKWYWQWSSGAKTWMGYAENEADIEKFRTAEFDLVIFEELTEFTEYQYNFLFLRNRSKTAQLPAQIRGVTNPGGEGMAWVFDRFIDPDKGHVPWQVEQHEVTWKDRVLSNVSRQYIPSTIMDNPKLPDREKYMAKIVMSQGDLAPAYLEGLWGKFRGQYFPKNPRTVEPKIADPNFYIIRAMDYGWGDPTCVLWLIVYPDLGRVDVAAELYGKQMTTDSIAHMVKQIEEDHGWQQRIYFSTLSWELFVKSEREGRQSIPNMLNEKGVWFTASNNDRIAGWGRIALLISRGQLGVWEGRAPNLIRTLTKLPRDPNRPNDVKVKGVDDHAAEALRYGVMEFWEKHADGMLKSAKEPVVRTDPSKRDPFYAEWKRQALLHQQGGGETGLPGWH